MRIAAVAGLSGGLALAALFVPPIADPVVAIEGKCVAFCGSGSSGTTSRTPRTSPPRRSYQPTRPRHDPRAAQRARAASLNNSANRLPPTVAGMRRALQLYNEACKLWPAPNHCNNARFAAAWLENNLAVRLHNQRRYAEAISHYRAAVRQCPSFRSECRTFQDNLNRALRLVGQSRPPARPVARRPMPPARTCGTCGAALRNDIRVRVGYPKQLRTYVTQARSKYANCIRAIRGGCGQTTEFWIHQRSLPACFNFPNETAFANCVKSAAR